MTHELPELPYALDALEPFLSSETLDYHYNKHHAGYVKKLNNQVKDSEYEGMSLEQIIQKASPDDGVFNNAAQIWNHTFYWNGMSPEKSSEPEGELVKRIEASFGSIEKLKEEFISVAAGQFGSGWAWLIAEDGVIKVMSTSDADTPIRNDKKPLLTCDVWEHAYYIDYRNDRGSYLEKFWDLINWQFVEENYNKA